MAATRETPPTKTMRLTTFNVSLKDDPIAPHAARKALFDIVSATIDNALVIEAGCKAK